MTAPETGDGTSEHGERVRVTSPRSAASRPRRLVVSSEIDSQTRIGDLYVRSLVRSQLRLAAAVVVVLGLTLGMVPLVFVLVPASRTLDLAGVPLPWLLLGLLVYPVLVVLGWVYVRRAERNEQDFADLVDPGARPGEGPR